MAATFQFDLVSPERKLASLAAERVQIPGAAGDFTAMPNHAPFLTTLRPGVIKVTAGGGEVTEYLVTGGFVEVSPTATTVLAEEALPRAEVTAETLAELQRDAETTLATAAYEGKTAADQRLRDVLALKKQLAL